MIHQINKDVRVFKFIFQTNLFHNRLHKIPLNFGTVLN